MTDNHLQDPTFKLLADAAHAQARKESAYRTLANALVDRYSTIEELQKDERKLSIAIAVGKDDFEEANGRPRWILAAIQKSNKNYGSKDSTRKSAMEKVGDGRKKVYNWFNKILAERAGQKKESAREAATQRANAAAKRMREQAEEAAKKAAADAIAQAKAAAEAALKQAEEKARAEQQRREELIANLMAGRGVAAAAAAAAAEPAVEAEPAERAHAHTFPSLTSVTDAILQKEAAKKQVKAAGEAVEESDDEDDGAEEEEAASLPSIITDAQSYLQRLAAQVEAQAAAAHKAALEAAQRTAEAAAKRQRAAQKLAQEAAARAAQRQAVETKLAEAAELEKAALEAQIEQLCAAAVAVAANNGGNAPRDQLEQVFKDTLTAQISVLKTKKKAAQAELEDKKKAVKSATVRLYEKKRKAASKVERNSDAAIAELETDELMYSNQIKALEAELEKGVSAEEGDASMDKAGAEASAAGPPSLDDLIEEARLESDKRLGQLKTLLTASLGEDNALPASSATATPDEVPAATPVVATAVPVVPPETVAAAGACFVSILKAAGQPKDVVHEAEALLGRLSGHKRSAPEVAESSTEGGAPGGGAGAVATESGRPAAGGGNSGGAGGVQPPAKKKATAATYAQMIATKNIAKNGDRLEGEITFTSGYKYVGEVDADHLRHGNGVCYYPSGKKYFEGEFVHGKRSGKGKEYKSGEIFREGRWYNGSYCGAK